MDRYMVISSDCHCGPREEAFLPYLDRDFRAAYQETSKAKPAPAFGASRVESFGKAHREVYGSAPAVRERGAYGSYDPAIRARELDRDGLAGEIVFPPPRRRRCRTALPRQSRPRLQSWRQHL